MITHHVLVFLQRVEEDRTNRRVAADRLESRTQRMRSDVNVREVTARFGPRAVDRAYVPIEKNTGALLASKHPSRRIAGIGHRVAMLNVNRIHVEVRGDCFDLRAADIDRHLPATIRALLAVDLQLDSLGNDLERLNRTVVVRGQVTAEAQVLRLQCRGKRADSVGIGDQASPYSRFAANSPDKTQLTLVAPRWGSRNDISS